MYDNYLFTFLIIIIESVDSISRDEPDSPLTQYITNAGISRARWRCLFHGTERHGTERNAGLFHGTDKCDRGTINLILEYLTRNSLIRICKVRNDKLYY